MTGGPLGCVEAPAHSKLGSDGACLVLIQLVAGSVSGTGEEQETSVVHSGKSWSCPGG